MDNQAKLRDTILTALQGAAEACSVLSEHILEAANRFRSGEIREGSDLLSRVMDDFSMLVLLLEDVRRCRAFSEERGQGSLMALDKESQEMTDLLKMAVEAQESRDWVYLADILEYEFSQKLGSWDGFLKGLSNPAEATPAV